MLTLSGVLYSTSFDLTRIDQYAEANGEQEIRLSLMIYTLW